MPAVPLECLAREALGVVFWLSSSQLRARPACPASSQALCSAPGGGRAGEGAQRGAGAAVFLAGGQAQGGEARWPWLAGQTLGILGCEPRDPFTHTPYPREGVSLSCSPRGDGCWDPGKRVPRGHSAALSAGHAPLCGCLLRWSPASRRRWRKLIRKRRPSCRRGLGGRSRELIRKFITFSSTSKR